MIMFHVSLIRRASDDIQRRQLTQIFSISAQVEDLTISLTMATLTMHCCITVHTT